MASNFADNQYLTRQEVYDYCHSQHQDIGDVANKYATYKDLNDLGAVLVDDAPSFADNQLVPFKYIIPIIGYRVYPSRGQGADASNLDFSIQNYSKGNTADSATDLNPKSYFWTGLLDPNQVEYNTYHPNGTYALYTIIEDTNHKWTVSYGGNLQITFSSLSVKVDYILVSGSTYRYTQDIVGSNDTRMVFESNINFTPPPIGETDVKSCYVHFTDFFFKYTYDSKSRSVRMPLMNPLNALNGTSYVTNTIVSA